MLKNPSKGEGGAVVSELTRVTVGARPEHLDVAAELVAARRIRRDGARVGFRSVILALCVNGYENIEWFNETFGGAIKHYTVLFMGDPSPHVFFNNKKSMCVCSGS